jgi:hypothetical protein
MQVRAEAALLFFGDIAGYTNASAETQDWPIHVD